MRALGRTFQIATLVLLCRPQPTIVSAFNFARKSARTYSATRLRQSAQASDDEGWSLEKVAQIEAKLLERFDNSHCFTSLSFFRFIDIDDTVATVERAKATLKAIDSAAPVKGTLLVAPEGFNGQFCVPTSALVQFFDALSNSDKVFNGVPLNIGDTIDYSIADIQFPFKKLIVRTKAKILTDGLPEEVKVNWNEAGPELSPAEWHLAIEDANKPDSNVVILDCRNTYEYEMGTFKGAKVVNTTAFSQTWDEFEDILKDVPKDSKILTFCTGGIRCVKTNAFLRQKMGYENVGRLQDGIIAYERWLKAEKGIDDAAVAVEMVRGKSRKEEKEKDNEKLSVNVKPEESVFVGKNFIFDRRRLED